MKDIINKIRELLDDLEKQERTEEDEQFVKNFDALEIPSIVCSIVDFLQPDLQPVETTVYWYMFRNSILKNGQQYIRVGQAALTNISASQHKGKDSISSKLVSRTLKALQEKGAITIVGETTHSGSMYKVNLPDEIQSCIEREKAQKTVDDQPVDENKELDYYNVSENRLKIFERDGFKCYYCTKQLTRFSAALDHIQPVSKGGDNSFENLTTSCLHCNSQRGNRPVMDIIIEKGNNS